MAEVNGKKRRAILKLGALATLLAGGAALAAFTPLGQVLSREGIGDAIGWLRSSTWAPVSYVAVYAGATALAIPGSILTLAGAEVQGVERHRRNEAEGQQSTEAVALRGPIQGLETITGHALDSVATQEAGDAER